MKLKTMLKRNGHKLSEHCKNCQLEYCNAETHTTSNLIFRCSYGNCATYTCMVCGKPK